MSADAGRLLGMRAIRGLGDGLVSVLLAGHLAHLGFTPLETGTIVAGTLLGSAAVTMAAGLGGARVGRRTLLLVASALMLGTGLGFAWLTSFWPLLVVAVVGTLNPTAGDVSVFLPVEQAALAQTAQGLDRAQRFAWYNVAGALAGGVGSLASAAPAAIAVAAGASLGAADRGAFLFYSSLALLVGALAWRLTDRIEHAEPAPRVLASSRATVFRLAALFSLDSFGGGFVPQSLLVLWLSLRFGLSVATTGTVFFAAGMLSAASQLLSSRIAARIGYVRTMVYTHLPANVFLVLAGVVPSASLAVGFLLLRSALSPRDGPARLPYVMALGPPPERTAASSITNVPRSLAAALPPIATGWMLGWSTFGWPLVVAGIVKAAYDLLLLAHFRGVVPADDA
jgi:MFS family permease